MKKASLRPVDCLSVFVCGGGVSFLNKASVFYLTSVPLRFWFLPPVGYEELLVIPHPLELGVGVLCLGGARLLWTHHVLKEDPNTVSSSRGFHGPFPLYLPKVCNSQPVINPPPPQVCCSFTPPPPPFRSAAVLGWEGPTRQIRRGRRLPVTFHMLLMENAASPLLSLTLPSAPPHPFCPHSSSGFYYYGLK